MNYKNVNVFNSNTILPGDKDLPVFVGERRLLVGVPTNPKLNPVYANFYNILGTFIDKISNSPAKLAVKKLYDRNLIFLGRDITTPAKNGIIGSFLINKTKFAGVIIDTVESEIDYMTGDTSEIDQCFYTIYFEFIRAVISVHSDSVKSNKKLHSYLIKYLFYTYLKLIGTNVILNNKQKLFLNILISYFFYRFMLGLNHLSAKERVFSDIDVDLRSETDQLLNKLDKYTSMKDLGKGMIDFNITNDSPTSLLIKMLTKFKPTVFFALTSSLDYLIALSIVSKYPMKIFKSTFVTNELHDDIENIITILINQTPFDTTAVSSLK